MQSLHTDNLRKLQKLQLRIAEISYGKIYSLITICTPYLTSLPFYPLKLFEIHLAHLVYTNIIISSFFESKLFLKIFLQIVIKLKKSSQKSQFLNKYILNIDKEYKMSVQLGSTQVSQQEKKEYQEQLAKNKDKIKEYKQDWTAARDLRREYSHKISLFWKNLGLASGNIAGLNEEQKAQLSDLKNSKYGAIGAMLNASNGVHSTVFDSLRLISSFRNNSIFN